MHAREASWQWRAAGGGGRMVDGTCRQTALLLVCAALLQPPRRWRYEQGLYRVWMLVAPRNAAGSGTGTTRVCRDMGAQPVPVAARGRDLLSMWCAGYGHYSI